MWFIDSQTNHQSALETQGILSQCTRMQAAVIETIYIPHVKSHQHEAMLFTVWLNPQIVLISATIAIKTNNPPNIQWMIHMNAYVITTIGNKSIQDGRHLVPMDTL